MHRLPLIVLAGYAVALQTQVDLTPFRNNKAAALTNHSTANFDNHNGSYPAEYLPTGQLIDASIAYALPNWSSPTGIHDNINCSGQTIQLPQGKYYSFNWLGATDGIAYVNGEFFAVYEDGTTESLGFVIAPWWLKNPSDGPITAPFLNEGDNNGSTRRNWNITRMFTFQHHLDNSKTLTALILPNQTASSQLTGVVSIHVFAITLLSAPEISQTEGPVLSVQNVRSTTNSIRTITPGYVNRLRSGDQVRVLVGITNEGVAPGTVLDDIKVQLAFPPIFEMTAVYVHMKVQSGLTVPNSEFFVHWGPYSVPAYTLSGTQYAEWYWYWQHNPANSSSRVWTYHKETYGEDFFYDMFFNDLTGSEWSAERFVEDVRGWGARYYVITTKHHDGFALFDTGNSSNRNSLNYGPKRDIIGELVNATHQHNLLHPTAPLYNGLYFSLPEWFNPAFAKYGHAGGGDDLYHRRSSDPNNPGYYILQRTGFAGGLARNAYNSSAPPEPYTGYIEVEDYLEDIMKPQMRSLIYDYDMDIMWCDVGGPTVWPELGRFSPPLCKSWSSLRVKIVPEWFNYARGQGRQVVANARCGANYSDFDNPEYSATSHLKTRKWESSEGSDPYSYGYNQDTPFENYRNTTYILHSLIDIVAKNGNYLIDVGPTGNGSIVEPSRKSLDGVGRWLGGDKAGGGGGEAIYDTQYWYVAQEDGDLRFTTKPDAFYIISLHYPVNGVIRTQLPLPVKEGDIIRFLGPQGEGTALDWCWVENDEEGAVFELYLDEEELKHTQDAWAFKASYTL
ncbi:hypothetical protein VNI00_006595 [Paramarasmius palmivorus]|uniref:alpha-L-fucosidase n=1 Tax=Paramarasmius palmivorus TaxID=297713 RepID=A0AAW0D7F8_9AGAR